MIKPDTETPISYRDVVTFPWDGWIVCTMRYTPVGRRGHSPTNILIDLYVTYQGVMFYIDNLDWEINTVYNLLTSPTDVCDIWLKQETLYELQIASCFTTECKTLQDVLSVIGRTIMLEYL